MNFTEIDALLRRHADAAEYVAFFGALAVLGAVEFLRPMADPARERRRRWPANFGLTLLNILVLSALPLSALAVADLAAARNWGLLHAAAIPLIPALLAGFLARTLVSYLIHVAFHKVPILWRVHRVHHTDRAMDVSTTVRFHPLEFAFSVPVVLGAVLALGIPPAAIIVYEVFDAAMAVFTHANLRMPPWLDRALRWLLVTPSMHRIHHSSEQAETDSNYGATLSIWDRVFGTYRRTMSKNTPLGLAECQDARANALGWLLRLPFSPRRLNPLAA